MATMTWKEFKDAVDKQMKEKGIDENTEIDFIDISMPDKDSFKKEYHGVGVGQFGISVC